MHIKLNIRKDKLYVILVGKEKTKIQEQNSFVRSTKVEKGKIAS